MLGLLRLGHGAVISSSSSRDLLSNPTVPLALLVVAAAGSLVFVGTFLRGPEYAAATGRARAPARGLATHDG